MTDKEARANLRRDRIRELTEWARKNLTKGEIDRAASRLVFPVDPRYKIADESMRRYSVTRSTARDYADNVIAILSGRHEETDAST